MYINKKKVKVLILTKKIKNYKELIITKKN